MEDLWLAWAKRLQAIASTGMHYGTGNFDRERYQEVGAIANEMLATLGKVPIATIEGLIPEFANGYATPKVEVRAAVFNAGRILLVRERSDDLWTLPGGFADVGRSAGENVVKEVREEANLDVEVRALIGIRHKARHEFDADARDFYKLYFLCEALHPREPAPGSETSAVGYFAAQALPPLSTGRVLRKDIDAAFAFLADPNTPAFFD
jgi:ADP-ribose pyrophosphatase YjhB (NUDIX family)